MGSLASAALDNPSFQWQPPAAQAKTTTDDPASPINALTKVDGVVQAYDGRGNRTGAAGRTWRYDSRNMLVGTNAPGMAATYGYYPEGGRAWKQVNGVTTLYLELDGIEWGTYEPNGTLKERTIRASGSGGAVVAVHAPAGGLIRLLPNRQGSVIGWLRPDGKLGGAYTYDAYGNSPQAGAGGPQFRYAGMRFDAETGLYHTPNRAYDPADGRWMQLDPIGIKDGLNRYAYVKNSPVMGVDPTGLYECKGSDAACADLDGMVNAFRDALAKVDRSKLDKKINDRLNAIDKKIGNKGDKGLTFTEGKTRNDGAYAEATWARGITFNYDKMKNDIPAKYGDRNKDPDLMTKIGAGVVAHETNHTIDQEPGIISGRASWKETELKSYTIQSAIDNYSRVNTEVYNSKWTEEKIMSQINKEAAKSVNSLCNMSPGYCR